MANAIILAIVAGFASALLAAAAISGPGIGLVLTFVAPLPLMIVAIGWQPLLAVLGGALTSAMLVMAFRGSAGIIFAILVTLPAYLAGLVIWRDHADTRFLVAKLCLGAALYGAFATVLGALSISTDYATLQSMLLRQSEGVYRFMMGLDGASPLLPINGQDPQIFITLYANLVAPLSAAVFGAIYMLNIWLAAKIAARSRPLGFDWPPVPKLRLPRFLLPLLGLTLLGAALPGYLGFTLELVGMAISLSVIALGYACIHDVSQGMAARSLILAALWALTLIFGFPVLLIFMAGLADLAFGWRDKILANRNP